MSNHVNVAPPIVLTIAGFDPSAGAGVAADLKTFAAQNCYGVAAITALTVQSTQAVKSVHDTPAAELRAQLDTLLEDIKISAIKIGMLGHRGNAVVVAEFLDRAGVPNVVLDPVMKSTSGETDLVDAGGIKYLSEELLKRATVVTPNISEAEILSGMSIKDPAAMEAAARKIVERGARAVVVKGGHMEKAIDILFDGQEMLRFGGDHIKSENTHGSGCTFASAIAAQLAHGRPLREAVLLAKAYVTKAIEKGYAIGKGPGPLDHFYRIHTEPPARGVHEVPQHGMHPAAEPGAH
ncbi:MAG TPA: bifunctional hydroxymethylpyrimidine kinase/phosphomethylpyrimidine kinase [Candidatus Saccharimonadales bacterium]|nr:bifunctional hydroxymethylpyrimidine kinase/phosphomethylpyrimidine kinase [Candidatus Saccharimonadales bacterium]